LNLTDVNEVMIVVIRIIEWEELVRACDILSSIIANLIDTHVRIEEDLIRRMMVIEPRKIRRKMGNDIFVMDYSEDTIEGVTHVVGEMDVAQARLPEVMNCYLLGGEDGFQLDCADCGNGSS
jgi:hypothetical protein